MKKIIFLMILSLFPCSILFAGEDFLGAPVIPGGKRDIKTDSRLEIVSPLSHEEVLSFYKNALKNFKDLKFRDWKEATYIEDDGNRPWHSITISKEDREGTSIIIVKDNWTWIIGTLVLRYIGVFVVLLFLFLGMSLSGAVISRLIRKMEGGKA